MPIIVTETEFQKSRGKLHNQFKHLADSAYGNKQFLSPLQEHQNLVTVARSRSNRWLIVIGERRGELSPLQAYQSYRQRFDLEHTFRFGKQNLLLTAFATPDVEHEQQWVKFVMSNFVRLIPSRLLFRFIGRSRS